MNNRLIKSNDAGGGGGCTNTVDLYNPFPDGGGVALYQLNGDATDVSGNYDGTASNVTYGAGQFGQAGVFNNNSSYISMTNPISSATSYTISAWINRTGNGQNNIAAVYNTTDSSRKFIFRVDETTNKLRLATYTGSGTAGSVISNSTINTNTWYNVIAIVDGGTISIYINGSFDNQTTGLSNSNTSSTEDLNIGRRNDMAPSNYYFGGSIDQVRIFSRALRPYEVEALYTEEYCTPTIVPSEHFSTVLYTGNNNVNGPILDVGFQPDFMWIKSRETIKTHRLHDIIRGRDKTLNSDTTDAESGVTNYVDFRYSNTQARITNDSNGWNELGKDYVSWNFKAGGAAVTNTDGTITSQVSANTEAGFSVVSYTGSGANATIGHGLSSAPKIVMNKCRSLGGTNWHVYSSDLGATSALVLNDTASAYTGVGEWGSDPSSSVLYVNNTNTNNSGRTYISYCFAEVEGFSNFGSYVGTGAAGNTIVTGFEPAFVMIKSSSNASQWQIVDNKRLPAGQKTLYANLSNAEDSNYLVLDFLENGFSFPTAGNTDNNGIGRNYIYMAFAADPTAVEPTLEDSFNTVLYTGNGGTNSITGVGFAPDFVWIKNRNTSNYHHLFDTVRGAQRRIYSNSTDSENNSTTTLTAFGSDGFTVSSDVDVNGNGNNLVAWNWKGAEIPAINSNGSIPSVVSANPAAGFSIVSWTGTTTTSDTIGHGLSEVPTIVLMKNRSSTSDWFYYTTQIDGSYDYLRFNSTNAKANSGRNAPTSNVFDQSTMAGAIGSGDECIAYCFAEVPGFSKFGSYTGVSSGVTVDVGFEPAFVMVKCTNNAESWAIIDNKRTSPAALFPPSSQAEATSSGFTFTFTSTGFSFPDQAIADAILNQNGYEYIYMAFANQF